MTTTTEEYWSVIPADGVEYPLNTLAKNIETWGDDRQGVIPLRGDDETIPWIGGQRELPRIHDSRTLTFAMWVIGCDDNGAVPISSSRRQQFEQNWRIIQRIFHNQGRIYTLRKRFYDESYTLRTADARVRHAGELKPSMLGRTGAKFTVDVKLADPYFYSTTPTNIAMNSAVDGAGNGLVGSASATVLGDFDVRKSVFIGTAGGAGCTGITLECTTSGHVWSIDGSANAGEPLMFDMANQLARINDINRTGGVHHAGSNSWFRIARGPCIFRLTCSTGSLTGTLTYSSVWN
jgi:hypothetical protein